jgi:hypothetical protein
VYKNSLAAKARRQIAVSGIAPAVYVSRKQSANKSSLQTFRQVTLQKFCQFI